jgi:hypothetical protein
MSNERAAAMSSRNVNTSPVVPVADIASATDDGDFRIAAN